MARTRRGPSRRSFLAHSMAGALARASLPEAPIQAADPESRQATGVKVGEVTSSSAIVWMRVTAQAALNAAGKAIRSAKGETLPPEIKIEELRGACVGAPGMVRLRYGVREDLADAKATDWSAVARS